MNDYLRMGSRALRKIAVDDKAKHYVLSDPVLYRVLRKAADRYIGGESLEQTLPKVATENGKGFRCSVEFMGENTRTSGEAEEATSEFIRIADAIQSHGLRSSISLDLSHIGLMLSQELCLKNLRMICEAAGTDTEVMISAEDPAKTDRVLETYRQVSAEHSNLGITLQAYLYRTESDFSDIVHTNGRIRIVKGAFHAPENIAMPRGASLNDAYLGYVEKLLSREHRCSIATHDHHLQQEVCRLITKSNAKSDIYEFESLYGIASDGITRLKDEGHPAKLYFVYGREWFLYLCNRLAEFPLNLFRALDDIMA